MARKSWLSGWRKPTDRQAWLLGGVMLIIFVGIFGIVRHGVATTSPTVARPSAQGTPRSSLETITVAALPAPAVTVLKLVDRGGPYPSRHDGAVFANLGHPLPDRARGYYREFTVAAAGGVGLGQLRLVVGQAGEVYFTSDRSGTFRQVLR